MNYEDLNILDVYMDGQKLGKLGVGKNGLAHFKYDSSFQGSGIEPSPIWMPYHPNLIYSFPKLDPTTYKGFFGLISDSLPDDFGNSLLNIKLEKLGLMNLKNSELIKLCLRADKGTGALEFKPSIELSNNQESFKLDDAINQLRHLFSDGKTEKSGNLTNTDEIISIGSSLGGAAAKAVIGVNFKTNEIRPGNIKLPSDFEYYIVKFDLIKDKKGSIVIGKKEGLTNVEFAYSKMVHDSKIEMTECKLLHDKDMTHFLTKRFDRLEGGKKVHMLSLHGMAHMDYRRQHDYNNNFQVIERLKLDYKSREEQFKRIVFNGLTYNTDSHTKNTSFIMDEKGKWSLSPFYDVVCSPLEGYAYGHKTSINYKDSNFIYSDYIDVAERNGIKNAKNIIQEITEVVSNWKEYAKDSGVSKENNEFVGSLIDSNIKNLGTQHQVKIDLKKGFSM